MFRDIFNKAFYFLQMALIYFGYTDAASPEPTPSARVIPLLDLEGLRQMVAFLDHLHGQQRPPSQETTV